MTAAWGSSERPNPETQMNQAKNDWGSPSRLLKTPEEEEEGLEQRRVEAVPSSLQATSKAL